MLRTLSRRPSIPEVVLDPSLVLWLPLYQLDGAAFASQDASGHPCAVTGALWTPKGRDFDGSDDKITIPHRANLSIADEITILTRIRPDTMGSDAGFGHIIAKSPDNSITTGYGFYLDSTAPGSSIKFYANDGGINVTIANVIALKQWQSLAATYDRKNVVLSRNSQIIKVGAATAAITTNTNAVTIGTRSSLYFFDGFIAYIAVYSRALTPLEVAWKQYWLRQVSGGQMGVIS